MGHGTISIASAGLVAIHPMADVLADEFGVFAWRLRAEAFRRFGYDPEGAFSDVQDEFGVAGRGPVKVWARVAGYNGTRVEANEQN